MSKSEVRDELLHLKTEYKLKVRSEKGKWPLVFSLTYVPEQDIKIDPSPDGLVVQFEISEHYPSKSEADCKLISIDNYTPNEKSPCLAPIMLQTMLGNCKKQMSKIIASNSDHLVTKFMQWLNVNITSVILTGNTEYFTNYMAEGMHGISERRYQINFDKYPKTEEDEEDDDDEIPELDFYSLIYPTPELLESNSSDALLMIQGGEMKNVSIFEMKQLSFTAKCDRCGGDCEFRELKAGETVEKSCPKCAKHMTTCMKPYGITESSLSTEGKKGNELQAGTPFVYLELVNCSFFDLISSRGNILEILCFNCSHGNQLKGIKLKSINEMNCQHCHQAMSIQIQNIQKRSVGEYITMVTHNSGAKHDDSKNINGTKKKKSKALKGITPGAPLPLFGTCSHYKNSKRWFRFDCCGRAYPCDICHEEECEFARAGTVMAKKMICGYCSREQGLGQSCHFCGKNLIKKISDKGSSKTIKIKVPTKSK